MDYNPISDIPQNQFSIIVNETYEVETKPQDAKLYINGTQARSPIELTKGTYNFDVSDDMKYFRLQLDR